MILKSASYADENAGQAYKDPGISFLAVAFFFLLAVGCIMIIKNIRLKRMGKKLQENEELLKNVFLRIPVGIAAGNKFGDFSLMNPAFEKIMGWPKEELCRRSWREITHPDDLPLNIDRDERFKRGEIKEYSLEKRTMRPDGSYSWIDLHVASLLSLGAKESSTVWIVQDINEKKRAKEKLEESERSQSVFLSNLPGMAYRCLPDRNMTITFVSDGCLELTGQTSEELLGGSKVSFHTLVVEEYREKIRLEWERALSRRIPFRNEYEITTAEGTRKWVLETGQGIYGRYGVIVAIEGIIIDITDLKKREKEIEYINEHDSLTDLYNRQHFEKKLAEIDEKGYLPLSVLIADINGLHLINEAYGQHEGDLLIIKSSGIIRSCCREKDIAARIGGDEFGIIMPCTDFQEAHRIRDRIKEACSRYNEINRGKSPDINISMGYATKSRACEPIKDIMDTANEYMRNRKLFSQQSSYSDTVSSIMATVYEKSQETEKHAERLAELSVRVGRMMNLMEKDIGELQLLGMLHDIGKIGIDDKILNKPGKLSDEEWEIMKRHPEIGYRIAKASIKLARIAEYILAHHERWDGGGYPRGLKGEEIPLLSRILAVADAFDAMTEDRVYRKAMSMEAAVEEIRKNSGTQFDPNVAEIFLVSLSSEDAGI